LSEPAKHHPPKEGKIRPEQHAEQPEDARHADRWIWGVWIAIALLSVAILPFATRLGDVGRAIAQFCGFAL